MPIDDALRRAAEEWIAADPDPATRAELRSLLAVGDQAALADRMAGTLAFGTAGIRGAVGAGSNRMNRAVVIRTTRGLADYLAATRPGAGPVVVGFDGRLSSRAFAEDAVGVLAAAGVPVRYFPEVAPTPLVAYAARVLGASAAAVVTASHNPPQDNGYKVYDANAAQIVPPADAGIAAAIDRVGRAVDVPRVEGALAGASDLARPIEASLTARYVEEVLALRPSIPADRRLRIVYTPLHGVGRVLAERVLRTAGFADLAVVAEQAEPDGSFPTVAFPNPEEPGALDLARALAARVGADLILANDPDADRLAVCLPRDGGWRMLTGNQVGQLLADFLLEHAGPGPTPLVVNSIVSSPMLASIAAAYGARWEATLTGFKWIANAALDLEAAEGTRFVFGYEEALGYTAGPVVRDKDGISAALLFAELAAHCRAVGETVFDRLARLYRRHGLWVSVQHSVVRPGSQGAAEIATAMELLGRSRPKRLSGVEVTAVTDFREGAEQRPRWLGASPLVALELGPAGRALVRPSGTEPKLKIYVDRRVDLAEKDDSRQVEARAIEEAGSVATELAGFLGFG
ncbi:MAG TPA: phospho-sugar mutase [Acidimicrobiia bacterium]|nr:phospho-sugar mutase [Acidimicrobiia bacterium]